MTWTLEIRKCATSETEIITAYRGEVSCDFDAQIERLDFYVDYNIEGELSGEAGFVGGEWNPAVLLKDGTEVFLYKDTELWFYGCIYEAPKEITAENRVIRYTAYDPKYRLRKAEIPYGGYISWGLESPKIKFTEIYLQIATGYNVGESRTYFIPYTQGVYFDQATYLPAGVADVVVADLGATIRVSGTDFGFMPRGFILIDRVGVPEIVYYDGNYLVGANREFRNCVRTQLGTVGGPHAPGVTVEQLVYKEITRDSELLELQPVDGDYTRIPYSRFTKNYKLGGFTFNQAQDGNVRGTYQIYDETASDVVLAEDIFRIACLADRDNGGAGFNIGQLNFDALNLRVNLYQYDTRFYTGYALDCLERFMDKINQNLRFYWSSAEAVMRLQFLQQEAIPDYTINHAKRSFREEDFDELFTAVRVIYQDEDNFSSLDPEYAWHTNPDAIRQATFPDRRTNAIHPDFWVDFGNAYNDDPVIRDGDKHVVNRHGINDEDRFAAIQNTWGFRNVMDQNGGSTLTAWWNKNYVEYEDIFDAEHEWHHSYYWFNADAETRTLDEIRIQIGDWRLGEAIVTVYGANNFDPLTMDPDDAAIDWFEVSPELTRIGGISGDTETSFTFETTNFTQPQVNILRITFHEIPRDSEGIGNLYAEIQEFFVRAGKTKELFIQLTNDIAHQYDPEYVYDETAYERLACVRPIVDKIEAGKKSDQEAMFLGRERLIEALTYYYNRDYTYDSFWTDRKPRIGDTVTVTDLQGITFTGVLIDYKIIFERGDPNFQIDFSLIDYNAGIIGG